MCIKGKTEAFTLQEKNPGCFSQICWATTRKQPERHESNIYVWSSGVWFLKTLADDPLVFGVYQQMLVFKTPVISPVFAHETLPDSARSHAVQKQVAHAYTHNNQTQQTRTVLYGFF